MEGVETGEQARQLAALGCDTAQGGIFAPAVPGDQVTAVLRDAARPRFPLALPARPAPSRRCHYGQTFRQHVPKSLPVVEVAPCLPRDGHAGAEQHMDGLAAGVDCDRGVDGQQAECHGDVGALAGLIDPDAGETESSPARLDGTEMV